METAETKFQVFKRSTFGQWKERVLVINRVSKTVACQKKEQAKGAVHVNLDNLAITTLDQLSRDKRTLWPLQLRNGRSSIVVATISQQLRENVLKALMDHGSTAEDEPIKQLALPCAESRERKLRPSLARLDDLITETGSAVEQSVDHQDSSPEASSSQLQQAPQDFGVDALPLSWFGRFCRVQDKLAKLHQPSADDCKYVRAT